MKNAWETYGAARVGGTIHAARVENDGARLIVTSLLATDDNFNRDTLESGRLFFGVDERLAVIKKVWVRKTSLLEATELARFELTQALLDPPDLFYYDFLPLEEKNGYRRFLAVAYHRREVDAVIEEYTRRLRKPSGFKLDALALAAGYLTFCRVLPGDLQVLVDLESDRVTLAVLYKRSLCALGRLEQAPGETMTITDANSLAVELKMKLEYLLAELFDEGITVPVARVIISGTYARHDFMRAALAEHISSEIALPEFHAGYFQPASEEPFRHQPEAFLIPLGLAVE